VESLARELYGFQADAQRLPSEYDQVFKLTDCDGHAFILKVMHPARDSSFVDLQCKTLRYLERQAHRLPLPRVIATKKGEDFTQRGSDGGERLVWLLRYLPGKVLAEVRPHAPELLWHVGELVGRVDQALQGFHHPATRRDLKWNLANALWIRDHLHLIEGPARRALLERAIARFEAEVVPQMPDLRRSVIYGDANDYNVLVHWDPDAAAPTVGLIDFADMHEGLIVADAAVTAAYALLGKTDPLSATSSIVAGFHRALPLEPSELQLLFPLIVMRLAVSVVNSAMRKPSRPDDPYITISEAPAWAALERLAAVHPRLAHYTFRHACGLEPVPSAAPVRNWLEAHPDAIAPIIDIDCHGHPPHVMDLGVGSTLLGADPQRSQTRNWGPIIAEELRRADSSVGIGRYDEARFVPDATRSVGRDCPIDALHTIHIGMDIFVVGGTLVLAPLAATVHRVSNTGAAHDGGATVILRHALEGEAAFFTLYRPLAPESVVTLIEGAAIARRGVIGRLASNGQSGGAAHFHFQLITDLLDAAADFPGMIPAAHRAVWQGLSPDPNLILGVPRERFPVEPSLAETMAQRRRRLGSNLSVSYRHPLKIVRGWRQHLYDDTGRPYLDVFNNVPLVGHSHPRIVEAVSRQLGLLNTNTRYLHDTVLRYAQRLTELLPAPLQVCYFVNSGSEANELAIRMARTHTRAESARVV
jgi:Ser/Thr protein kinase RdoA (MazF antagonist)